MDNMKMNSSLIVFIRRKYVQAYIKRSFKISEI